MKTRAAGGAGKSVCLQCMGRWAHSPVVHKHHVGHAGAHTGSPRTVDRNSSIKSPETLRPAWFTGNYSYDPQSHY